MLSRIFQLQVNNFNLVLSSAADRFFDLRHRQEFLVLSEEELAEFKLEAMELLDAAEKCFLNLDQGGALAGGNYDSIFRSFHSLKGTAGMLELNKLQAHMHELENKFILCKEQKALTKDQIDYFLVGCDNSRKIMDGQSITESTPVVAATPASVAPALAPATAPEPEMNPELDLELELALRGSAEADLNPVSFAAVEMLVLSSYYDLYKKISGLAEPNLKTEIQDEFKKILAGIQKV